MLFAGFWTGLLNLAMLLLGVFLILLVLIQRGRGGGLVGALGGAGGSSPFGSRAGDTFTRITLVVAGVWLLLAMVQIHALLPMQRPNTGPSLGSTSTGTTTPPTPIEENNNETDEPPEPKKAEGE